MAYSPRKEAYVALQSIAFMSKSQTSVKTYYSKIDREACDILHGLEKFHHYCLTHEISMILTTIAYNNF